MPSGPKGSGGVYLPAPRLRQADRPRHPQESSFYRLVECFYGGPMFLPLMPRETGVGEGGLGGRACLD